MGNETEKTGNLTELVTRFQQTKEQALFEEIYSRTYQKYKNVVYSKTKNASLTDDVLQDAYLDCYMNIDQLRDPSKFNSWMLTILSSRVSHAYTNKFAAHEMQESVTVDDEGNESSFLEEQEDDVTMHLPENHSEDAELQRLLLESIDTLKPDQKRAIMLYFYENLSQKEIAREMGVPENTVKTYISRGKKKLNSEVSRYADQYGLKLVPVAVIPFALFLFGKDAQAAALTAGYTAGAWKMLANVEQAAAQHINAGVGAFVEGAGSDAVTAGGGSSTMAAGGEAGSTAAVAGGKTSAAVTTLDAGTSVSSTVSTTAGAAGAKAVAGAGAHLAGKVAVGIIAAATAGGVAVGAVAYQGRSRQESTAAARTEVQVEDTAAAQTTTAPADEDPLAEAGTGATTAEEEARELSEPAVLTGAQYADAFAVADIADLPAEFWMIQKASGSLCTEAEMAGNAMGDADQGRYSYTLTYESGTGLISTIIRSSEEGDNEGAQITRTKAEADSSYSDTQFNVVLDEMLDDEGRPAWWGYSTAASYDADGRLTSIEYSDDIGAGSPVFQYTYDDDGRLISRTIQYENIQYTSDIEGVEKADPDYGDMVSYTDMTYAYDDTGRLTGSLEFDSQGNQIRTLTCEYNEQGILTGMTLKGHIFYGDEEQEQNWVFHFDDEAGSASGNSAGSTADAASRAFVQDYLDYIRANDMNAGTDPDEGRFSLVDVDGDDVPEIYCNPGLEEWAPGSQMSVMSWHDGQVDSIRLDGYTFYYEPGKGQIWGFFTGNSPIMNYPGAESSTIYSLENGKWQELLSFVAGYEEVDGTVRITYTLNDEPCSAEAIQQAVQVSSGEAFNIQISEENDETDYFPDYYPGTPYPDGADIPGEEEYSMNELKEQLEKW